MGITYKGFDVDLRCPVTLKVISEQYLGDEAARLRFFAGSPSGGERAAFQCRISAHWLAAGAVHCGWARSMSGHIEEGLAWIEEGIEDYRATDSIAIVPYFLALKAEAFQLAGRTSEALEAIREAKALVERFEGRWMCAELHRLKGVFLAAMGADETEIEASFRESIRIAKEQKSISLEKRAEATYAEYRCQRASGSGGHGFRLAL